MATPVSPWLIAISVILPMFMEVLDTTIANVALNNIAGSMSVSYSQATWVLTSYLPLTAWLGNRFQRKRFLLFCILLFTASSLLCGLSIRFIFVPVNVAGTAPLRLRSAPPRAP